MCRALSLSAAGCAPSVAWTWVLAYPERSLAPGSSSGQGLDKEFGAAAAAALASDQCSWLWCARYGPSWGPSAPLLFDSPTRPIIFLHLTARQQLALQRSGLTALPPPKRLINTQRLLGNTAIRVVWPRPRPNGQISLFKLGSEVGDGHSATLTSTREAKNCNGTRLWCGPPCWECEEWGV